jgi:hypothetical protein
MDSFSVESKEYQVTEARELPDDWEEMNLDERIDMLFGE